MSVRYLLRFYRNDKVVRQTNIHIKKALSFGSDPTCHVRLKSQINVEPVHVIISCKDEKVWIEMKGETYINDFPQQLNETKELPLDHVVRLGSQKSGISFTLSKAEVESMIHTPPNLSKEEREDSHDLLDMDDDDDNRIKVLTPGRRTRSNSNLQLAPTNRKRSLSSIYREFSLI